MRAIPPTMGARNPDLFLLRLAREECRLRTEKTMVRASWSQKTLYLRFECRYEDLTYSRLGPQWAP